MATGEPPQQLAMLTFDGRTAKVNDHIYFSLPWNLREGEPYLVGRIIAILPASVSGMSSRDYHLAATQGTRVRVAQFLRPRDISLRYKVGRVLFATMYEEDIPVELVRGFCDVRHRDSILDLDGYRKLRDTFYWSQFYDKYLHKYFDAIPTDKIQNTRPEVVKHLQANFEWVLTEVGTGNQLCDAQKGCSVCHSWTNNQNAITCARCSQVFHLSCLDPPLVQKPKIGYSWSCAPCSRAYDAQVESYMEGKGGLITKKESKVSEKQLPAPRKPPKGREKAKARGIDPDSEFDGRPMRTYNGWPFRYFGALAKAEAVLDPHDSLYPLATSRLGKRYQADVPDWDPVNNVQVEGGPQRHSTKKKATSGKGKSKLKDREEEDIERGNSTAVQGLVDPRVNHETLDQLVETARSLPVAKEVGVDIIDKALSLVEPESLIDDLVLELRKLTARDLGYPPWSGHEKQILDSGVLQHGDDLEEIAPTIRGKRMKDVVRRFYIHIGHDYRDDGTKISSEERSGHGPSKSRSKRGGKDHSDSDAASVYEVSLETASRKNWTCAVCLSKETSGSWWKCPGGLGELIHSGQRVMCYSCSFRWRHYGQQFAPTNDDEKVYPEVIPVVNQIKKRVRSSKANTGTSPSTTPVPPSKLPQRYNPDACVLCFQPHSSALRLVRCDGCALHVHIQCYGHLLPDDGKQYCELCFEDRHPQKRLGPIECVLCKGAPSPALSDHLSALDCFKTTEYNNYAHLICSIWHSQVSFINCFTHQGIEGITNIPMKQRGLKCSICRTRGGATIKCADCPNVFHVSCAWREAYHFAFDLQSYKKRMSKEVNPISFQGETGCIVPLVWCSEHLPKGRFILDLSAYDEESASTALHAYIMKDANPKISKEETFATFRRAKRLETLIAPARIQSASDGDSSSLSPVSEDEDFMIVSPEPTLAHGSVLTPTSLPSTTVYALASGPPTVSEKIKQSTLYVTESTKAPRRRKPEHPTTVRSPIKQRKVEKWSLNHSSMTPEKSQSPPIKLIMEDPLLKPWKKLKELTPVQVSKAPKRRVVFSPKLDLQPQCNTTGDMEVTATQEHATPSAVSESPSGVSPLTTRGLVVNLKIPPRINPKTSPTPDAVSAAPRSGTTGKCSMASHHPLGRSEEHSLKKENSDAIFSNGNGSPVSKKENMSSSAQFFKDGAGKIVSDSFKGMLGGTIPPASHVNKFPEQTV